MTGKTNIQVSRTVRAALAELGKKGDTYDDILKRLMTRTYNWDNVYVTSVPVQTKNGIYYVDVIMPKLDSIHINGDDFADAIATICEENAIEVLDESEVPFFNDKF